MASPSEQIILIDEMGQRIDIEECIQRLRLESRRVLVDDEVGTVIYVGDLNIYRLKRQEEGGYLAQKVNEISSSRFSKQLIRRQIGSVVCSVTADTVFLVKKDDFIKKVRAENLKKGMILATGEKVFS